MHQPEKDELQYQLLHLDELDNLPPQQKLSQLLLRREWLTQQLGQHGKCYPPTILARAYIHEALEYDDLAAFDAFVVYQLCQKELSDEFVTDLEAHELNGEKWMSYISDHEHKTFAVWQVKVDALAVFVRCLAALGASKDAKAMLDELESESPVAEFEAARGICARPITPPMTRLIRKDWDLDTAKAGLETSKSTRFGMSRREVYPWSDHEPDRNSSQSLSEISQYLQTITSDLEARITTLPAFDNEGKTTGEVSKQLGLFAKHDLRPGAEILREKSLLTAIRPLEDAICDACGQELEDMPFDEIKQCDGDNCDITYCSEVCKVRAVNEYHRPAIADDESDNDLAEYSEDEAGTDDNVQDEASEDKAVSAQPAPFCGNEDLSCIGRSSNTDTPEWDLYFLLLTRTAAMSITQQTHPLDLREIRYLWADFNPCPLTPHLTPEGSELKRTLPFSVQHNLQYTLDYFSTLSLTFPEATPYSAYWLENFDFWVLQTLFAKFRGVANATQSTFDGKPEIASVHPGWCLANHSCAPNVRWTPKGVRKFYVRTEEECTWTAGGHGKGVKAGEEVFSHYTDVRLPLQERRERLREVLGGDCHCERCLAEEAGSVGIV